MKEMIEFKNVHKNYKIGEVDIQALKNARFTIAEGEFVVILGASGAGKSTLLNMLGGMDRPTHGDIIVDGENITEYSAKKLEHYRAKTIGFVFQFYNLIANLTAQENIEFATAVASDTFDSQELLQQVGLMGRKDNFPSQLSGGEQQRVAIARAIAKNPRLLLCDEPTGALDYETGKEILQLLVDINKKYNTTVIVISHNAEIAKIADKVIRVRSGAIESVQLNAEKIDVKELEW